MRTKGENVQPMIKAQTVFVVISRLGSKVKGSA
jgi:hypothetical protein